MKRKKASKKKLSESAAEIGPEDGADPRTVFQASSSRGNRKALQLCRQVQRALGYALADCGDDVLGGLMVESVEPAPNEKHLMVTVSSSDPEVSPVDALARVHRVLGRLRSEVASAIHRRRVPELTFRCLMLPPPPVQADS